MTQKKKHQGLTIYDNHSDKQIKVKNQLALRFKKHALFKQDNLTEQKVKSIMNRFHLDVNFLMVALQIETLKGMQEAKIQAEQNQKELIIQAEQNQKALQLQIEKLQLKVQEQTSIMDTLVAAQRKKDFELRESQERAIIRKNIYRLPARDAATSPELITAWKVVEESKSNPYVKALKAPLR